MKVEQEGQQEVKLRKVEVEEPGFLAGKQVNRNKIGEEQCGAPWGGKGHEETPPWRWPDVRQPTQSGGSAGDEEDEEVGIRANRSKPASLGKRGC